MWCHDVCLQCAGRLITCTENLRWCGWKGVITAHSRMRELESNRRTSVNSPRPIRLCVIPHTSHRQSGPIFIVRVLIILSSCGCVRAEIIETCGIISPRARIDSAWSLMRHAVLERRIFVCVMRHCPFNQGEKKKKYFSRLFLKKHRQYPKF